MRISFLSFLERRGLPAGSALPRQPYSEPGNEVAKRGMPGDLPSPRDTSGTVLHHETEGILDAAAEFLWSDEMAESLEAFSTNHAELFKGAEGLDVEDGEHRLEWTTAHLDFQQLFEFQLEQFVASQEFTQEQFVAACQDALDASSPSTSCGQPNYLAHRQTA